jgi:hypothetical protein
MAGDLASFKVNPHSRYYRSQPTRRSADTSTFGWEYPIVSTRRMTALHDGSQGIGHQKQAVIAPFKPPDKDCVQFKIDVRPAQVMHFVDPRSQMQEAYEDVLVIQSHCIDCWVLAGILAVR